MPLYNYICEFGHKKQRLRPISEANKSFECEISGCGAIMQRFSVPPGLNKVEVLDNGFMTKAVERPADIEEMKEERRSADIKERIGL
jgi:hypothetical protein